MKPEFEIDENVIIVDFVDDTCVYMTDFVVQIIIDRDCVQYLFENVSRPVNAKRVLKYSSKKENELLANGYIKVCNLI